MLDIVDNFVGGTKYVFVNEKFRLDPLSFNPRRSRFDSRSWVPKSENQGRRLEIVTGSRVLLVQELLEKVVALSVESCGEARCLSRSSALVVVRSTAEFPGLEVQRGVRGREERRR